MNKLIIISVFLILSTLLYGQNYNRSVILINGTPYIADLSTNGSVISRYQAVPDYFSSSLSNEQFIANYEKQGLINQGEIQLYTDDFESDIPKISDFKKEEILINDSRQFIAFSRGRAILNKSAVDQIRLISDAYIKEDIKEIIINSYHDNSDKQKILANNRGRAIKDLLKTFGVSTNHIQTNMPYGQENEQLYFVYLSYVK